MRTIKFKVIDAVTKELIGYERIGERGQWEHIRVNRKEFLLGSITDGQEYNHFLRLQFTGLLDKNGKEIYEGDILKERYYPLGADKDVVEYYKECEVVYFNGGFGVKYTIIGINILNEEKAQFHQRQKREVYSHPTEGEGWQTKPNNFTRFEIIGNIHENNTD